MDFYMYKSLCPRWYGIEDNIRHIVVAKDTTEQNVKQQAKQMANGTRIANNQQVILPELIPPTDNMMYSLSACNLP